MRSRNYDIVKARTSGETLQQIGDRCGISKERVRQIVKIYGVPSGRATWKTCELCETKISLRFTLLGVKLCHECSHLHVCHKCGTLAVEHRKYYCESCQFEERPCGWCGKLVRHRVRGHGEGHGDNVGYWKKTQTWYCSHRCGYYGSHPRKDVSEHTAT